MIIPERILLMSIGGELSLFWNERSYNAIIHKKGVFIND